MAPTLQEQLQEYRNVYKWMFLPFIIAILGFTPSYYLRLSEATWHQHMHGITATLWYLLMITQPRLAVKGNLKKHRQWGMYALIVAGGVVLSAATIIPQNIKGGMSTENELFKTFLYGVSVFDLVTIIGFVVSIIIAISKVKDLQEHSLWMISTVFWALMPALGRLLLFSGIFGQENGFIGILGPASLLLVIPALIICWRYKKWHIGILISAFANVLYFFIEPIGNSMAWRAMAEVIFKY